MHEMGHTLGLGHGGSDGVNYKPNYHSVMNYTWQFQSPAAVNAGYNASWQLDYSRAKWAPLNEAALNENAGIGGHVGHTTRVGSPGSYQYVSENGKADYNGKNGFENPIPGGFDLNRNGGAADKLVGHNDWSNLDF